MFSAMDANLLLDVSAGIAPGDGEARDRSMSRVGSLLSRIAGSDWVRASGLMLRRDLVPLQSLVLLRRCLGLFQRRCYVAAWCNFKA